MSIMLIYRVLILMCVVFSLSAYANKKNVPSAYQRVAEKHGIPDSIIYALALAESGYTIDGIYNPWPWTLNIEGDAQRYDTAEEALSGLQLALGKGKHVDVGIMQINTRWHTHRVPELSDFLNPHINLESGAKILAEQRERSADWWEAVGRYHAPNNDKRSLQRATRYRQRVEIIYKKIMEKAI